LKKVIGRREKKKVAVLRHPAKNIAGTMAILRAKTFC